MTRTYLPRAVAAGARMVVGCRVDRLVSSGSRALAADVTHADGTRGTIRCRNVFVCGGAIQSPAILQRSGIRGLVGRSLAVHPTVKLAARFADDVNVPDDVPVHQVKEFAPDLSFGGSATNPGLVALALSDHGPPSLGRHALATDERLLRGHHQRRARRRASAAGPARPVGHVPADPSRPTLLRSGLARLALLMLEAGATEVYPSFRGAPRISQSCRPGHQQDRFAVSEPGS